MKAFVEFIVKHLVDKPDEVTVTEIQGEKVTVLELRVAPGNLGMVIGRKGKIANAIRTLLTAASMRQGKKAVLEIIES